MYACMDVMYVTYRMYVCMYVYVCMYSGMAWHGMAWHGMACRHVCTYVCMCVCMYVCMHACMYVYDFSILWLSPRTYCWPLTCLTASPGLDVNATPCLTSARRLGPRSTLRSWVLFVFSGSCASTRRAVHSRDAGPQEGTERGIAPIFPRRLSDGSLRVQVLNNHILSQILT